MFHAVYKDYNTYIPEENRQELLVVAKLGEGLIYDKETKELRLDEIKIKEWMKNGE